MKKMLFLLLLLMPLLCTAQSFDGCPPQGSSTSIRIQKLDVLKNRTAIPTTYDSAITLQAVLTKGDDTTRWTVNEAAQVKGYVILVKSGGIESVNCKAKDSKDKDTHIEIALALNATNTQAMIVEVTPRIRALMAAQGIDWSTKTLEKTLLHHYVMISGWMFFDQEHWYNSVNTNPTGTHLWRATAWEIHPITGIKVLTTENK